MSNEIKIGDHYYSSTRSDGRREEAYIVFTEVIDGLNYLIFEVETVDGEKIPGFYINIDGEDMSEDIKLHDGEDWSAAIRRRIAGGYRAMTEQEIADDNQRYRKELAMEAGMLCGVSAYNEVMGW